MNQPLILPTLRQSKALDVPMTFAAAFCLDVVQHYNHPERYFKMAPPMKERVLAELGGKPMSAIYWAATLIKKFRQVHEIVAAAENEDQKQYAEGWKLERVWFGRGLRHRLLVDYENNKVAPQFAFQSVYWYHPDLNLRFTVIEEPLNPHKFECSVELWGHDDRLLTFWGEANKDLAFTWQLLWFKPEYFRPEPEFDEGLVDDRVWLETLLALPPDLLNDCAATLPSHIQLALQVLANQKAHQTRDEVYR